MPKKIRRTLPRRIPVTEMLKDVPWFEVEGHQKYPPRKLPKFSGDLQTPIVKSLSRVPAVDEVGRLDEVMSSILSERIDKLILLLKYYDIQSTSDPWLFLSLRLACSFVPGLRVLSKPPRKRGRPARWKGQTRDELIAAVEAVRAERPGRSISRSIEILKDRDPDRWGGALSKRSGQRPAS